MTKKELGKLRFDLITPEMEQALAEVLMAGAEKYTERGWEEQMNVFTAEEHMKSAMRHLNEVKYGKTVDEETGLHPIQHLFTRIGMAVTVMARTKEKKVAKPLAKFPRMIRHPEVESPYKARAKQLDADVGG